VLSCRTSTQGNILLAVDCLQSESAVGMIVAVPAIASLAPLGVMTVAPSSSALTWLPGPGWPGSPTMTCTT
jgi:hypothetical protein